MNAVPQPQFSEARLAEISELVKRYPAAQSALLPVLHMAQQDFGYLSMEVQYLVAATLGLRIMAVREVVTFYTMFREKPCGKISAGSVYKCWLPAQWRRCAGGRYV